MFGKKRKGKPSLVEQIHNLQQSYIKAKHRGDTEEAQRLGEHLEWARNELRKQISKGKKGDKKWT